MPRGLQKRTLLHMTQVALKIVIVGGVAGGMSAATRARRLNEAASITVFEGGPYVSFANCGLPYALGGIIKDIDSLVLQTPESIKRRFNIDVEINTEVLSIDRRNRTVNILKDTNDTRKVPYDKLILALGAEPWQPQIEGLSASHVFALHTIPDLNNVRDFIFKNKPKRVAVIGGGFIGLEAAENLQNLGLEVSILEYASQVFPPVDSNIAAHLHDEIRKQNVKLFLNARIQSVKTPSAECPGAVVLQDGTSFPTDLVLAVTGSRPRTELVRRAGLELNEKAGSVVVNPYMQTSDPNIYAVGDMVATHHRISLTTSPLLLAGPANRQGRLVADHIFSRRKIYKGNIGTSVCKVFELTVGSVGLSVRALRALGRDPQYVTVHPPHHAGYYPGAQNVTMKLVFEKMTGLILGAQAVAKAGVDKRIDVLATAIQGGMNVFDLEELELGYAPPFGSAKDVVNMAGFVASNVMRGDVEILHEEDMEKEMENGTSFVDVRSQMEFMRGHVKGAVNIPLDELRARVGELGIGKRTVVYCWVGYRGYLAYRILKQHGFESVMNLDGGLKNVMEGGFVRLLGE